MIAVGVIIGLLGVWLMLCDKHNEFIGVLLMLGLLLMLTGGAFAHDNPENWIGQEKRQNAIGQYCCGNNDCQSFTVDQVKTFPDGYHFPDGDVIAFGKAAPSIDHFYWKCVWGGEIKCVFAPLGAS